MTELAPPIVFVLHDGAFRPASKRMAVLAEHYYQDGGRYTLVPHETRSRESHNHMFAEINNIWQSLPDDLVEDYPTPERLRKVALIRTGWCDTQTLVCSSKAEAARVAAFVPRDDGSIVVVRESTVTRLTAKSQSSRAMGREDFQASKQAVLDWCAALIGTTAKAAKAAST